MLKYSWSVALLKGQVIKMSVVIIGGNERMEQQYKQICKKHKCKAIQADLQKTQMQGEGIYKNVRKFEDTDRTARSDHLIHINCGT